MIYEKYKQRNSIVHKYSMSFQAQMGFESLRYSWAGLGGYIGGRYSRTSYKRIVCLT